MRRRQTWRSSCARYLAADCGIVDSVRDASEGRDSRYPPADQNYWPLLSRTLRQATRNFCRLAWRQLRYAKGPCSGLTDLHNRATSGPHAARCSRVPISCVEFACAGAVEAKPANNKANRARRTNMNHPSLIGEDWSFLSSRSNPPQRGIVPGLRSPAQRDRMSLIGPARTSRDVVSRDRGAPLRGAPRPEPGHLRSARGDSFHW